MAEAPIGFQLHALAAFGLFALWPFTRLVHVFSAPVGYLTRPYIVYRSRDDRSSAATGRGGAGNASVVECERGWPRRRTEMSRTAGVSGHQRFDSGNTTDPAQTCLHPVRVSQKFREAGLGHP